MENKNLCRTAEEILEQGERLLEARPFCHKMKNDLTAATLICKLHQQGLVETVQEAEGCVRRMQIAVDTGIYPDELLHEQADLHQRDPSRR
jgi:hypothetical protein